MKGLPFVFKGVTDVTDCETSRDVMIKANLDWSVNKTDIWGITDDNNHMLCNNYYATYREDTNVVLGVVKDKYEIVQNLDAFDFFDKVVGERNAIWQTAGCFDGGKVVFVSAKLSDFILINNEDPVDNYLVFMTSHDGSMGVKILLTPIRVICQNTLSAAIRNAKSYISYRHTRSIKDKIDQADKVLGISRQNIELIDGYYNQMFNTKMSDEEAARMFAACNLSSTDFDKLLFNNYNFKELANNDVSGLLNLELAPTKANTLIRMADYYNTGIGQEEIKGTAWGVYNAITGYYSNVDNVDGHKRMKSLLLGQKSSILTKAGNELLELV